MIHRLVNTPMTEDNYRKELNTIITIGKHNGYPEKIILNIHKKHKIKRTIQSIYPASPDTKPKQFTSIEYHGKISLQIAKHLRQAGINTAFKTTNRLSNIKNAKDKINNDDKSGIYELNCEECNSQYIGQTGRSIKERYKEHISHWKHNHPDKSQFAKHLLQHKHTISDNNQPKLLHTENKGRKLNILEQIEINKRLNRENTNIINEQLHLHNSPILDIFKYHTPGHTTRNGHPRGNSHPPATGSR